MPVAGDNHAYLSGEGASEHMIVICILRNDAWHCYRRNHVGQAPQFSDSALR